MILSGITHILNVRQPWASMLIHDTKTAEIRTRCTKIRGRVGIRASLTPEIKRDFDWLEEYGLDDMFFEGVPEGVDPFPKGVILGTANLVGCNKIESKEAFRADVSSHMNNPDWWQDGLHSWKFEDPVAFAVPVECTSPVGAITWIRTEGLKL